MAAVQKIARAKLRHFRLFRWPPLKVGRLFMVQVVVAILWLRLIASWFTTEWSQETGEAAGHLFGMPKGGSLWSPTSHRSVCG